MEEYSGIKRSPACTYAYTTRTPARASAPMDWELRVEDTSVSEGFMEVHMKGPDVAVRFEAPYDEHGLRFFRRLAEEGLRVRMRLSYT